MTPTSHFAVLYDGDSATAGELYKLLCGNGLGAGMGGSDHGTCQVTVFKEQEATARAVIAIRDRERLQVKLELEARAWLEERGFRNMRLLIERAFERTKITSDCPRCESCASAARIALESFTFRETEDNHGH